MKEKIYFFIDSQADCSVSSSPFGVINGPAESG